MMERNKELENKELEEKEALENARPPKDDICPHCCQPVTSFPYLMVDPIKGWVECAVCGVVFSPKSLRQKKLERSQAVIKPTQKLIIPAP